MTPLVRLTNMTDRFSAIDRRLLDHRFHAQITSFTCRFIVQWWRSHELDIGPPCPEVSWGIQHRAPRFSHWVASQGPLSFCILTTSISMTLCSAHPVQLCRLADSIFAVCLSWWPHCFKILTFEFLGPQILNSLPVEIRQSSDNLMLFNKKLFVCLFQ